MRDDVAERLIGGIRPTHILHLAWDVTHGRFWSALDNLDWTAATLRLFRAFADTRGVRFVGAGTCAEYDWSCNWLDERETPTRPSTLYGTTKNALREILEGAASETSVSFGWGRIFFLYGPYEAPARLIPYVITALLNSEKVACGEGVQKRDFMHVDDVARAFVALLGSDVEGPVNIASGDCVPIRRVVEEIAGQLGADSQDIHFGERPTPAGDPPCLEANVSLLRDRVHFSPSRNLDAGISETIKWWRSRT